MQCVDLGGRRIIKKSIVLVVTSVYAVSQRLFITYYPPNALFFNDTATTEIYTLHIVGSVRCV